MYYIFNQIQLKLDYFHLITSLINTYANKVDLVQYSHAQAKKNTHAKKRNLQIQPTEIY